MAAIKEDYCSRETYRLLLEKGFDGEIHTTYDKEGYTQASITLQMAMKWLREVHNIFIEIKVGENEGKTWYDYDILPINGKLIYWKGLNVVPPIIECNTPEEAIEIGLKYCLEYLI